MKVKQIYTGCLAEAAYYIESKGEAAIIDPLRETEPYLQKAEENGSKIKYIFETHFHADFVSGHIDLAEKTGATIVFGPMATTEYEIHSAKDGEEFKLGDVTIKVLHTPGHTMESSCYLLIDEDGKEHSLFTGDTLFIGDVGRPDLAVSSDLTKEDLAGHLFESLRNKVMPLPDDTIIYPAHGAGSACGKNLSTKTWDTLGNQKKENYALNPEISKEDFIKEVTDGILPPPQYFAKNAMINKTGYESLDTVMERGKIALEPDTFEAMANHEGALVLDTRTKEDFAKAHIPNSIFIGIDGSFAPWVGALITDIHQPIVFIADEGREEEVVTRLSRVGYDNTLGYLKGGLQAWSDAGKETDSIEQVSAHELKEKMENEKPLIVDARKPGEFEAEHAENAKSVPLDFINESGEKLSRDEKAYVHCKSGYRSLIFVSILRSRGYKHLVDIRGGYIAMKDAGVEMTDYVCPSTLE